MIVIVIVYKHHLTVIMLFVDGRTRSYCRCVVWKRLEVWWHSKSRTYSYSQQSTGCFIGLRETDQKSLSRWTGLQPVVRDHILVYRGASPSLIKLTVKAQNLYATDAYWPTSTLHVMSSTYMKKSRMNYRPFLLEPTSVWKMALYTIDLRPAFDD